MSKASKSNSAAPKPKNAPKPTWIDWEIEFDKNTSEDEKAQRLMAINKYILDYLSLCGIEITSINFSTKNRKLKMPTTNLRVDLKYLVPKPPVSDKALGETRTVPSQIPPPTKPTKVNP